MATSISNSTQNLFDEVTILFYKRQARQACSALKKYVHVAGKTLVNPAQVKKRRMATPPVHSKHVAMPTWLRSILRPDWRMNKIESSVFNAALNYRPPKRPFDCPCHPTPDPNARWAKAYINLDHDRARITEQRQGWVKPTILKACYQMNDEIDIQEPTILGRLGRIITNNPVTRIVDQTERMTTNIADCTEQMKETTTSITETVKVGIDSIKAMLEAMVPNFTVVKDLGSILLRLVKVLATVSMANATHRLKVFFMEVTWNFGAEIASVFSAIVSKYFKNHAPQRARVLVAEHPDANRLPQLDDDLNVYDAEDLVEHEFAPGQVLEANFQIDLSGLVSAMSEGSLHLASSQAAAPLTGALLSTLLVTAFGLPAGNFDQCLSFFGNRCRNLNNVVSFSKNAVPLFTAVADWILSCFRGPLADQTLDSTLNGYADFVREVLALQEVSKSGETLKDRLEKDEKLVFQIDKLYRQGIEYSKELSAKRFGSQLSMQLNQCMKIVEKMKKLTDFTGVFGNKPRMEPIVIHLFGDSGVGKSGMSWPLASDMNAALTSADEDASDFAKNIYFRNVEQEFWDGYHGQNVVCYDDFGQRVDGVSNPNEEFMEIIRVGNIAPYPLHMATLEEKQRTKFCSKVVLLTSNKLEQNVNSLTFSDAYRRRINICGKVENIDGVTYTAYSKTTGTAVPRLDVTKTDGPVDTKVYKITLFDAETQQPLTRPGPDGPVNIVLDYEEFLELSLKKMKELWNRSRSLNKELGDRLTTDRVNALRAKMQIADEEEVVVAADCRNFNVDQRLMTELSALEALEKALMPKTDADKTNDCLDLVIFEAKSHFQSIIDAICSIKGVLILVGAALVGFGLWSLLSPSKAKPGAREIYEGPPQRRGPTSTRKPKTEFIVGVSEPAELEATSSGDFNTPRRPVVQREHCPTSRHGGDCTAPDVCLHKADDFDLVTDYQKYLEAKVEAFVSGDARTVRAKLVQREATTSGDFNTPRPKTVIREHVDAPDAEMQAWKDRTAQELISHRIITNTFKILKKRDDDTWMPLLNGLFIRDSVMLAPYHLIPALKNSTLIRIENVNGARFTLPFSACKYKQLFSRPTATNPTGYAKDACLIQFPRYVGSYSDIVKHFQTNQDLKWTRATINLYTVRNDGKRTLGMILGNKMAKSVDRQDFTIEGEVVEFRDGYEYDLPTSNGDCGAPLILQEPTCLRKIAGIHVLALVDGHRSYAQAVSNSDLVRCLKQFDSVIITDLDNMANFQFSEVQLPVNELFDTSYLIELLNMPAPTFSYVGECDTKVFVPGNTDIRPSVIHGQVSAPITRPAVLFSPSTNLLHKNLQKCALETPYIPKEAIDRAVASYKPLLFNGTKAHLQKVLSFEEAVAGVSDQSEYLSSINRSSSPGFPWVLYRPGGTKGKTAWLGDGDYVYDEVVRNSVTARIDTARRGIRTPCIWTDTLKDERRTLKKVEAQETRAFGNGPMDFTIAFRMYFLGFLAHIMENRINNEQSLGTNVYSGDWKATRDYLQRKGKKVIAGDFSKFDGTLNSCIMWEFVNVINEWYDDGPENALIRQTLFMEVINSVHLCDGVFYMMNHSQPSGNPITTALNSFYNSVSMRIVFDICRRKAGAKCDVDFQTFVAMVSYGDDNVVNFADSVATWFNQNTITEAYKDIGMIYTDELKSGDDMADHRLIGEVAYLKRHFREEDGRVFAPLDLAVVLETCNWVRDGPDSIGDCKANCETAISELAQHPKSVFSKYTPLVEKAFLKSTEETLSCKTYEEYEEYALEQYFT